MLVRSAAISLATAASLIASPVLAQVPPRPGIAQTQPPPPMPPSRPPPTPPSTGKTVAPSSGSHRQNIEAARKSGKFQLDFDKADLGDVIQTISDYTGKLFIVPENIRGKVTIKGPNDARGYVTADEAYNAFLSALEAAGWTLYPAGKFLKLVEKRSAANSHVETFLDPRQVVPDDERMVTKIIRLSYVDSDTIVNPLKQLISKDASLLPVGPDTLIITEVSLNLRRLEKIIEALDQPGGGEEMRVIQVEYADAPTLADKITQAFEDKNAKGKAAGGRNVAIKAMTGPSTTPETQAAAAAGAGGAESEGGPVSISRVIPDERTNKLIIIANPKAYPRIEDLIRQLDVPTGETGRVNVYYLENANAEELSTTLQGLAQGGGARPGGGPPGAPGAAKKPETTELFAGEVKISADKSTNSLVIVASAQDYKNLTKVIEKLDIRRRQVFVEAVIMEVDLQSDSAFGVGLHVGDTVTTDKGIAPLLVASKLGQSNSLNPASLVSLGGFLAGLQGPPISAANLGITLPSFGLVLHALEKSSDVNILSTPHLLTSDNQEAEITVGQNVPFQAGYAPGGSLSGLASTLGTTGTTGTTGVNPALASGLLGLGGLSSLYAPIQRQNVELKLKIKPQINESDYVRMQIEEQTEEIASQDPVLGPTTSKRTAKTVVTAKDQETVVLGGLIQERVIRSVNKAPILGDIPLIGHLFRDDSTTKIKTNLLLFLTPYIIRDQTDFRRIFERKMKERAEFVAAFYGTASRFDVPIDFARKAGPLGKMTRTVEAEAKKATNGGPGTEGEHLITPRHPAAPATPGATPTTTTAPSTGAPLPPGTTTAPPAQAPAAAPANPGPAAPAPTAPPPAPPPSAPPPAGATPAGPPAGGAPAQPTTMPEGG